MTAMPAPQSTSNRWYLWIGAPLVVAGLCGHVFAARAIGGYSIAYRDHLFGFVVILLVTGLLIAAIGSRAWRGRRDITVLLIGIVQAAIGLLIYIRRFDI